MRSSPQNRNTGMMHQPRKRTRYNLDFTMQSLFPTKEHIYSVLVLARREKRRNSTKQIQTKQEQDNASHGSAAPPRGSRCDVCDVRGQGVAQAHPSCGTIFFWFGAYQRHKNLARRRRCELYRRDRTDGARPRPGQLLCVRRVRLQLRLRQQQR
jgi:hypothetical protein